MNLAYFQMLLQESIDNAASTVDFLTLSQALEKLNLGQIRTVATYSLLPAVATNEGLLVWVTADERLYWSTGSAWYSIVTDNRSQIWSWGSNASGRLGDNTTTSRSSPVSVVGGFSDWCQVSAGCVSTAAIRTNGTVWAWGQNRLGDGSNLCASSPVSVVGGFSDWCQVSAGAGHIVAVRTAGSTWAWGFGGSGELGNGDASNTLSPVSVVGGFTNWCQASAGTGFTLALRSSGSAWAWGCNFRGQLGDNTTTNTSSPVSVVGGFSDWCQVTAGYAHSVAVRSGGSAWAWGFNSSSLSGALGDGTTTNRSSPVSVVGGFIDWCQVSAGGNHTMALRIAGSAWAWGNNSGGRLGNNATTSTSSPVSVVGGFTNWCQVSANAHSLAVRTSGSAWAWGANNCGQLGDCTLTNRSSPVSVVGGFTNWCQVSAGNAHSVGLVKRDFT
jgi:alpha-tubulin suppressor-like RCC1 family protein